MSTLNIPLSFIENPNVILKVHPFASCPGLMSNPQWLELPIARTNFHSPKDVRANDRDKT